MGASSVYRPPVSVCDGTEVSPVGYLSAVHGTDEEQVHLDDRCLAVPSPLIPKQVGARSGYAFTGNRK